MSQGLSLGLNCLGCGEACITPVAHLAREEVSTSRLRPDDPCLMYEETIKWGSRWRVVTALHKNSLGVYVDWMGSDDDFKNGGITIPSVEDDDPSYWNTVGECMEIAKDDLEENTGAYTRKRVPRQTGEQWANQLVEMAEQRDRALKGIGTFGSHIGVMR